MCPCGRLRPGPQRHVRAVGNGGGRRYGATGRRRGPGWSRHGRAPHPADRVVAAERTGRATSVKRSARIRRVGPTEAMKVAKRVVLAYSGGLDTSVAVRWLIENH